jgi:eukaryotic-like serine/threonine-protein kinase
VGTRIVDYEITGVRGEDETGVLYTGRHLPKGRQVTVKVLADRWAIKKDVVDQWTAESRVLRALRHCNLVEITDVGVTADGTVFRAMEALPGESLRGRLGQVQRLPPFEAINVVRQVAHGLGVAHDAGIVHGALTPDDVFLCKQEGRRRIVRRSKAKGMRYGVEPEGSFDLVKLLELGMASLRGPAVGDEAGLGRRLRYMSPEQAQGQRVDLRSDLWSLGVVFYEMLTGTFPFGGDTLADILRAHALGVVIPPSRRAPGAGIDARIDLLIVRCLKKSPVLRLGSTGELCAALDDCITDGAFLRDAHRLPGIAESGIDLSEGLPQARGAAERAAETPAAAPVAETLVEAAAPRKPAMPLLRTTPPVAAKPPVAPSPSKPAGAPIAEKSAAPPSAQASADATVDDPAAAMITPQPLPLAADPADPVATAATPPPVVEAEDPAAAMLTPPPVPLAAAESERPEDISNAQDQHDRFPTEVDVRPGRPKRSSSRRAQLVTLVTLLLLAGGIAVWSKYGGGIPPQVPPVASPSTALVHPSPSPPIALAPPAPTPAAPLPPVEPAAAAAPATNDAAPAAAPPVPARPAELDSAMASDSRKHVVLGPRATPTKRRPGRPASVSSATAPTPAAEPPPEPEPPAPSKAAAEAPAAEAPNAEDLLGEAQRTRKRGHFAAAISKARQALDAEPTAAQAAQAYELIGICSCSIGEASAARDAASHLAGSRLDLVKAMCDEMGQAIE